MNILIADDDLAIQSFIQKGFVKAGHQVAVAADGKEALFLATTQDFDLIVLDRMMPHLDGLSLIRLLRKQGNKIPIIILSALVEISDKVEGLKAGGDDYLTKPFAFEELWVRAELLYERYKVIGQMQEQTTLVCQDLELDCVAHEVKRGGNVIVLQAKEYQLLLYLIKNKNQVISRSMLLEKVWEYTFDPQTNVIDVHISRLRNKLEVEGLPNPIETVRGFGYIIKDK
jgi:two-component system OmpR family response regulator